MPLYFQVECGGLKQWFLKNANYTQGIQFFFTSITVLCVHILHSGIFYFLWVVDFDFFDFCMRAKIFRVEMICRESDILHETIDILTLKLIYFW